MRIREEMQSPSGRDVKQYAYSFEDTGGWIDPGESNRIEGFLIYEVPESVEPANPVIDVVFSSQADAVWKLG